MAKRFSFKGWLSLPNREKFFFRSLKEISYVLLCEKNKISWISAEKEEFAVWYKDVYGKDRRYYPDFFVDGKIIVEIKPRKHQNGKLVQLKAEAMKEFCKKKGYTYMMVSPRRINKSELEELIDNKTIEFSDECKYKIQGYLSKRK